MKLLASRCTSHRLRNRWRPRLCRVLPEGLGKGGMGNSEVSISLKSSCHKSAAGKVFSGAQALLTAVATATGTHRGFGGSRLTFS